MLPGNCLSFDAIHMPVRQEHLLLPVLQLVAAVTGLAHTRDTKDTVHKGRE